MYSIDKSLQWMEDCQSTVQTEITDNRVERCLLANMKCYLMIDCDRTENESRRKTLPLSSYLIIRNTIMMIYHSYLMASIGSRRAAFFAGYQPKNTPVNVHTAKLMMMVHISI